MTWVRLDDTMPEHPKIAGLSDRAFRLHVEGLCYSARTLSDGVVPAPIARRLGTGKACNELLKSGVWELLEDGSFSIHDYLEFQMSRADAIELREARSQAGKRGAQSRWGDGKQDGKRHGKRHSKPHGKQDGKTMPHPDPLTDPSPKGDGSGIAEEVKTTSSAPRARDPIWDAFVAEVGPAPETKSGRGAWNAAAKQLRDINADPALVPVAFAEHRHIWPNIDPVTPTSIVKHWTQLTAGANGHVAGETRLQRAERIAAEKGFA